MLCVDQYLGWMFPSEKKPYQVCGVSHVCQEDYIIQAPHNKLLFGVQMDLLKRVGVFYTEGHNKNL